MKWRWLIGVPLVLVSGGCGAVMTIAHRNAVEEYNQRRADLTSAMQQHGDAFRSDLRTVSPLPFLDVARAARSTKQGGRDASAFLAPHLEAFPHDVIAKLGDAIVASKFPEKALAVDVSKLDLTWMRELDGFDHWEIVDERPVGYHGTLNRSIHTRATFLSIARARLLQGLAARDVVTAGREVESFARLVASSENAQVALATPGLMEASRSMFEKARDDGLDLRDDRADWRPPDRHVTEALKRSMRAYLGAVDYHADAALLGDLLTAKDATAGRCTALNEAAILYVENESITGDRYHDAHDWIAQGLAATQGQCRLTLVREAWDNDDQTALVVGTDAMCDPNDEADECVVGAFMSMFPGIRDALIEFNAQPAASFFDGYKAPRR